MLIHVHEEEYHRIARELHTDVVGQLTLMGMSVDELRGASNAYARPLLDKLHDQIYNAGTAMLRLSHKIHPFSVEYLGLTKALTKLCRDAGIEHGISIHWSTAHVLHDLPLDVSLRIFRLAQLALQNLLERQVKSAGVELVVDARTVLLRITDAGGGVDLLHRENAGMAYMREQALSLGGTCETMAQNGMVVEVSVPIRRVYPPFQNT
jgi:signal transduction histidine kinase